MKFIDWFSGIGGFRKGLEDTGHKCVGFCEYDKYAYMSYVSMHCLTDEQRNYIKELPLKERQKEILKEKYRNGEWYRGDVRKVRADEIPKSDIWCFGFPCQEISIAGTQVGFTGKRSSLFFRIMHLLEETAEEEKPTYLFIENVKNLLSVNGGWDYARLLFELDKNGYDAEWQVLNSKNYGVPQNRERVFIIGHLRGKSGTEVLPIERTGREDNVALIGHNSNRRQRNLTYLPYGITGTLDTAQGGGRTPQVGIKVLGLTGERQDNRKSIFDIKGDTGALIASQYKEPVKVAIPVLTPDRATKRQNGRRAKENGEPMFTLTSQDRHGVAIEAESELKEGQDGHITPGNITAYAKWYPKENCHLVIRKLTPKECFRLQGWDDEYFKRAQLVNSDSQLYKQAGNGVTVNVIKAIGERLNESQKD